MDNYNNELLSKQSTGVSLNRLDMMVSAMWEIILEKGCTREQMNAKLDEVREKKISLDPGQTMVICPNCGKKVTEGLKTPFEGKCLYCGTIVTIYPGDHIEEQEEASDKNASDPLFGDEPLF